MATRLIRCINGHVFDAAAAEACPTCGWTEQPSASSGAAGGKDGKTENRTENETKKQSGAEEIDKRRRAFVIGGGVALAGIGAGGYFLFANKPAPVVEVASPPAPQKPAPEPQKPSADAAVTLPRFADLQPIEQTAQIAAARTLGLSAFTTNAALVTRIVRLVQLKPTDVGLKQRLVPHVKSDQPMALNEAGAACYFGYGVQKDEKLALDYLTRAASEGVVRARSLIAQSLLAGGLKPRDPDAAADILTLAAKADGPGAGQAAMLLKQLNRSLDNAGPTSADLGAAIAQKNWDLTVKIARVLADQKIDSGYNTLGERHWKGEGLPKDPAAAIDFWRKATAIGYSVASYNLSVAAKTPPTGSPSLIESLVWLMIARIQTEDRPRAVWITERITEQTGLFDQSQWSAIRTLFADIDIPGPKSR